MILNFYSRQCRQEPAKAYQH